MSKNNLNFFIKTIFYTKEGALGPGIIRIMELVQETGSLSKAYEIMGISSSKGWRIMKQAEKGLGFSIISSTVGGKGGGNSKLTKEGEDFLEKYHSFKKDLDHEAKVVFNKYF